MPPIARRGTAQLTLDARHHPRIIERMEADPEYRPHVYGALKIKGEFTVPRDLNAGDRVVITITGPDGEVITHSAAEVEYPQFRAVKNGTLTIGVERVHTAALIFEELDNWTRPDGHHDPDATDRTDPAA